MANPTIMAPKETLNLRLLTDDLTGKYDIPKLYRQEIEMPDTFIPFNMAKTHPDKTAGIHFYIDDYQFERVWRKPEKYIDVLKQYKCVCSPDFSMYLCMPLVVKLWNVYRSRLIGQFWQQNGINVIPTLQWAEERTFQFCFDGIDPDGTVSVSTLGAAKGKASRSYWIAGMKAAMRIVKPKVIMLYGELIDFDFGNCKVIRFKNPFIEGMHNGR